VPDSAIALWMDKVDCVFVGAEAVLENGGIVNKLGTFTLALCAKQFNKPFYVFAQSLKFLKKFPLQQDDIYDILNEDAEQEEHRVDLSTCPLDFTQPELISNIFTDLGIFTPAAVSDEII
jgi:translation initiation factor eIF-2B subunit alpha